MQVNANKDDRNVEMINQKSSTPFNFEAVFAPPQASEIPPMPRNLVDEAVHPVEARRPPRYYREYTNGWLGRTPSKQQHRTKAIEALAEIRREDAQQKLFEESKMENGRKKTSAGTEDSIKPLMEKDLALIDTHYEGAPHMETKPTSTTGRRVPLYCTICHRGGHSTQICYHNTDNPKDVLRCYNCGKTGHLAVRCPLLHSCGEDGSSASSQQQKDDAKSKAAKKRRNTAKISQKKKAAAEAEALKKNSVGLELICKVMADRPLREETEKHNPDLYEEMLTLMLDAITVAHS